MERQEYCSHLYWVFEMVAAVHRLEGIFFWEIQKSVGFRHTHWIASGLRVMCVSLPIPGKRAISNSCGCNFDSWCLLFSEDGLIAFGILHRELHFWRCPGSSVCFRWHRSELRGECFLPSFHCLQRTTSDLRSSLSLGSRIGSSSHLFHSLFHCSFDTQNLHRLI